MSIDKKIEKYLEEKTLDTFAKHQVAIARKTLKMSDAGAKIMGGMTKDEARAVLKKYGIKEARLRAGKNIEFGGDTGVDADFGYEEETERDRGHHMMTVSNEQIKRLRQMRDDLRETEGYLINWGGDVASKSELSKIEDYMNSIKDGLIFFDKIFQRLRKQSQ